MALSTQWTQFVSQLSGDARAALKASLSPLLVAAQATSLIFNQKLLPLNIKITTYSTYVSTLRTLYSVTVQASSPISQTFNLFSDSSKPKTSSNVAPEMGVTQESTKVKTDPIYTKLSKAEHKLRKMKLEKELIVAQQLKNQEQIDSLQSQIGSL